MTSFHSWTCLILGEHITNCMMILCMSWLCSVPDDLFKSSLNGLFYMCCLSNFPTDDGRMGLE